MPFVLYSVSPICVKSRLAASIFLFFFRFFYCLCWLIDKTVPPRRCICIKHIVWNMCVCVSRSASLLNTKRAHDVHYADFFFFFFFSFLFQTVNLMSENWRRKSNTIQGHSNAFLCWLWWWQKMFIIIFICLCNTDDKSYLILISFILEETAGNLTHSSIYFYNQKKKEEKGKMRSCSEFFQSIDQVYSIEN